MEPKNLLTIQQTAEMLGCSAGFVRKRIALTEHGQQGGWPKAVYINLQPNGAKSLFRVNRSKLEEFLISEEQDAKVSDETTSCSTGTCTF